MRPGVATRRLRVLHREYLDLAIPDGLAVECLGYWDGLNPFGAQSVHVGDGFLESWEAGGVHVHTKDIQ